MAPSPGCSTAAHTPNPAASTSTGPRPVTRVSASATTACPAAAVTRTGFGGSRSSSRPASGASAVMGMVMARKTAATAQDACDPW
jgi:hypothetical protein